MNLRSWCACALLCGLAMTGLWWVPVASVVVIVALVASLHGLERWKHRIERRALKERDEEERSWRERCDRAAATIRAPKPRRRR